MQAQETNVTTVIRELTPYEPTISNLEVTIGLFGGLQCGKTALTSRYVSQQSYFPVSYNPTILDKKVRMMQIDDLLVQVRVIDTSGSKMFDKLRAPTMTLCDGYLLVFSVTDRESFKTVKDIKQALGTDPKPHYLVGNKTDLERERVVAYKEAKEFCNGNNVSRYIEISAKEQEPWDEIFETMIREILPYKLNKPIPRVEICEAATAGNLERVKELIDQGHSISQTDIDGDTPLHKSAAAGRTSVVTFLLECNADVNVLNTKGYTPLHLAVLNSQEEIVKQLIAAEATVTTYEFTYGLTPMHDATKDNIVMMLKQKGANIDVRDKIGRSVLHLTYNSFQSDRMASLIRMGAQVNSQDENGWTVLHYFCYASQSEDVTEMLIRMGADSNLADKEGWTSLHMSCWRGKKAIVQKLVAFGAKHTLKTATGKTPRQLAVERGHHELARFLALKEETPVEKNVRIFTEMGTRHGWLTKEGHLRKTWKRRYFVITFKTFKYYVDESLKKHKGNINIKNASVSESDVDNRSFVIVDGGGKKFNMQAESEQDKKEWVAILKVVISA